MRPVNFSTTKEKDLKSKDLTLSFLTNIRYTNGLLISLFTVKWPWLRQILKAKCRPAMIKKLTEITKKRNCLEQVRFFLDRFYLTVNLRCPPTLYGIRNIRQNYRSANSLNHFAATPNSFETFFFYKTGIRAIKIHLWVHLSFKILT